MKPQPAEDHLNMDQGPKTPRQTDTRGDRQSTSTPIANLVERTLPEIAIEGVTVLWTPPDPIQIAADICFVHGLKGHPQKTWQYKKSSASSGSNEERKTRAYGLSRLVSRRSDTRHDTCEPPISSEVGTCYWPFDLIPDDCGDVRILTYGYDSHPSKYWAEPTTKMTITQHAEMFLQRVADKRRDCPGRPIIFVAHSLGGIIVKDAISVSGRHRQPHLLDVSRSCFAVFFFGTPHRGSYAATYGKTLSNAVGAWLFSPDIYTEVLSQLQPGAEKLSMVERNFNSFLDEDRPSAEKVQIYSFYEVKGLSSLKLFNGKVVPDWSSSFNGRNNELHSFISENHMDMARFSSKSSPGYVDFISALKGYLSTIRERSGGRARRDEERSRTEREALQKALDFKTRCVREQQLARIDTTDKTFTWIWSSPFASWLESGAPMFWISGKPASGKSTLMDYVGRSAETLTRLQRDHAGQWEILHFFFDFRADKGIRNNLEGLLRSLLYQLCDSIPNFGDNIPELSRIVSLASQPQADFPQDWTVPVLRSALIKGIETLPGRLLILIDGLDEYEGEKVELTRLLKALRFPHVKLCVASRPEPPFPDAFAGMPSFQMQTLNYEAIKDFGLYIFEDLFSSRQHDSSTWEKLNSLAAKIAQRSQGVFLWARFAFLDVIEGLGYGEQLGSVELQQRLEDIPLELRDVYSQTFKRLPPKVKKVAGFLLQLVCAASGHLTADMLKEAIKLLPDDWDISPYFGTDRPLQRSGYGDARYLLAVTGGTVEVYPSEGTFAGSTFSCDTVSLIHRTVETYLQSGGWQEILGGSLHPALGAELWLRIWTQLFVREGAELIRQLPSANSNVQYIDDYYRLGAIILAPADQVQDREPRSSGSGQDAISNAPKAKLLLLVQGVLSMLSCARAFETLTGQSSRHIVEPGITPAFIEGQYRFFESDALDSAYNLSALAKRHAVEVEPIHFAVCYGLAHWVAEYLEQHADTIRSAFPGSFLGRLFSPFRQGQVEGVPRRFKFIKALAIERAYHWVERDELHVPLLEVLKLILTYLPGIEDQVVLDTVCRGSRSMLKLLLEHRTSSIKTLKGSIDECKTYVKVEWDLDCTTPIRGIAFGSYATEPQAREIVDALVENGVEINTSCGLLGGVLHYAVTCCRDNNSHIEMLVKKGADINRVGPDGTPLEFFWALVHSTDMEIVMYNIHNARERIRCLIDLGAVNGRKDPNGLVPSVIQMRLFGCNWTDYQESRRFYREGPQLGTQGWSGPVPLHPDHSSKASRHDLPYQDALMEYHAGTTPDGL